jgi:hypothetical protein
MEKNSCVLFILCHYFCLFYTVWTGPVPTFENAEASFKSIRAGDKDAVNALIEKNQRCHRLRRRIFIY